MKADITDWKFRLRSHAHIAVGEAPANASRPFRDQRIGVTHSLFDDPDGVTIRTIVFVPKELEAAADD